MMAKWPGGWTLVPTSAEAEKIGAIVLTLPALPKHRAGAPVWAVYIRPLPGGLQCFSP
jgi:hypothetical protein